jgi:hypothetical protein
MTGTVFMTAIDYLPDACACPSPRRRQSGGRLWELTNRTQCTHLSDSRSLSAALPCACVAASGSGFLAKCYEINPRIQQAVTPLASKEFVSKMSWCEVAATARGKPKPGAVDAGHKEYTQALQTLAIKISGAHGSTHTVMVKWRSVETQAAAKTTIFSVGFYPEELKTAFINKAAAMANSLQGFHLLDHELVVSNVLAQQGLRFFNRVPEGWTDETMLEAMIEQAGLDPDHVLSFGYVMLPKAVCNAPSGEMWFNFSPAGCVNHGATEVDDLTDEPTLAITQPPSSFFVTHKNGSEDHIKVRKAGACQTCWMHPGRHANCVYKDYCKMCLVRMEDMEGAGKRHACCQGDMFREKKAKSAFDHSVDPEPPKEPSSVAEELRTRMAENIREAKRKRQESMEEIEFAMDEWVGDNPDFPDEVPAAEAEEPEETEEQPSAKSPKAAIASSPGSASQNQE